MSENSGIMSSVIETVKTVVYALLIAGAFRTVLFQPFFIPSGSMKDTLLVGDFLFVNKMAYGYSYASCPSIPWVGITAEDFCGIFMADEDGDNPGGDRLFGSEPEVGDVVVFRHPDTGQDFIKRLIGRPGDRIRMIDGLLHINDEPVQVEPAGTFTETWEPQGSQRGLPRCENSLRRDGYLSQGEECTKSRFIETLPNGTSHAILNIGTQGSDDTGVFTVPEGHYFMMGDNRDNSGDSRAFGFVPYEDIVGRADRVMFSSAGRSMLAFWTWRGDRFFAPID